MFHFPAFPPTPYEFEMQVTRHDSRRVTPFGHPGITARLTAPPGLSRPPTSFIGPWYQGIHRPPLPTTPQHHIPTDEPQTPRCSRPLCKSQPTTNPPPQTTHHHTAAHGQSTVMPGTKTTTPNPRPHPTSRPATTQTALAVPSEPQQGAHRRTRPDRPALSPPRTHPHPAQGTDASTRPYSTRPGHHRDPTRQCLRPEPPHPPVGGCGTPAPRPGRVAASGTGTRCSAKEPHAP
jgi:hypothetical protein